jgi:ribonuclease HI
MDSENQDQVVIYTDGACNPNPGPGAWAAVILFPEQPPQELVGTASSATNNRMELQAAIEALKLVPGSHRIRLVTDSRYLQQGVTQWLPAWQRRNWRTADSGEVKNQDLWQALSQQLTRHYVQWVWTKGHADDQWNERADFLAQSAIPRAALPLDEEGAVHIFTAASYLGKAKRGGWGVVLRYGEQSKSLHGSEENTSGNRMHLLAAISGLEAIQRAVPIHLYTTSDYLKDGATFWVKNWAKSGWRTKEGKPVAHKDLWARLLQLGQKYDISWHVVPRSNLPVEMTNAKQIATQAARDA